jgi:hypothetical protein
MIDLFMNWECDQKVLLKNVERLTYFVLEIPEHFARVPKNEHPEGSSSLQRHGPL